MNDTAYIYVYAKNIRLKHNAENIVGNIVRNIKDANFPSKNTVENCSHIIYNYKNTILNCIAGGDVCWSG